MHEVKISGYCRAAVWASGAYAQPGNDREIASQVHGIRRGSAVEFEFEGIRYRE